MILLVIEIKAVPIGGNEFGAGVDVKTAPFDPRDTPQAEGATWVGICTAINDYMRSRGAPTFDCLQQR